MQSGSASPGKAPVPPEDLPPPAAAGKEAMAEARGEEVKEDGAKTDAERGGARPRGRPRGRPRRQRPAAEESESGVVKVKKENLAPRITCPLCQRYLREATTICECLHTFCRKCIYKKLAVEELNHCPVCKIDLGCAPAEKLRADHNLQALRSKLIPVKGKKINAEVESPVTAPVKIKERSISSLVVDPPRLTTSLTGRRTRAVTRKAAAALRGLGPILDPVGKDNDNTNKHADNISLLDSLSKVPQTRRKASQAETSSHHSSKDKADHGKDLDKAELWKPLNCLVDAASKTKSFRSSPQSSAVKGAPSNESPSNGHVSREKSGEHLRKSIFQGDKKDTPLSEMMLKRKGPGRGRPATSVAATTQKVPDVRALNSIWFSLIASFEQKGFPQLAQIPTHYLRINDGSIPASSIQRYIMQKLSLQSESEVELTCCGQSVNPAQPVRNLIERWLRFGPSRPLQTVVGSSGGEYVMVISYGRPK
ncbi:E3 ubiquitin protein ligase DRIP2 [Brachypodium distachyon]|uniref:RING-type domain-containing protein n=1 Tax=Brachypodium distachyon TaxID=15368 RepID=I1IGS5_BRADI|nr:E3 ubiquitin protein ligase DRIP2 [Brachypodium distachyon]KQJ85968.1 hypothetical protein BRADI_4g02647v3 [Brachypodium distachyon]|eukprot:XP_003579192.1 E3 ubiquitin protein ligase DRIP2 [Brachypodium distachyon]